MTLYLCPFSEPENLARRRQESKVASRGGLDLLERGIKLARMATFHVENVENIKKVKI